MKPPVKGASNDAIVSGYSDQCGHMFRPEFGIGMMKAK
jgi:hypothetical protein